MAAQVWERFGDAPNYVEPFFGSGAVLLNRPHEPRTETVNDLDCYLANFWRAVQAAPEEVAHHCDWPVNEADQLARHKWLLAQEDFRQRMQTDPDFYDAKIAGWWVWGVNIWIGDGWCRRESDQLPHLGDPGKGVHRRLPHLGDPGKGVQAWFLALQERLRRVRVACGEWHRILGPLVTFKHGVTAIFLDPPYEDGAVEYSAGGGVSPDVGEWARANGYNLDLRIALCGYEGEQQMPDSWECLAWKAAGGYGHGNGNERRERIWFSPGCLRPVQGLLKYPREASRAAAVET